MVKDLYFMMSYRVYSQIWLNLPRVFLQLPMHYSPLVLRTNSPKITLLYTINPQSWTSDLQQFNLDSGDWSFHFVLSLLLRIGAFINTVWQGYITSTYFSTKFIIMIGVCILVHLCMQLKQMDALVGLFCMITGFNATVV